MRQQRVEKHRVAGFERRDDALGFVEQTQSVGRAGGVVGVSERARLAVDVRPSEDRETSVANVGWIHGDDDVDAAVRVETLAREDVKAWHVEGMEGRKWVLLDYVDVVVHVFYSETRGFYSLESLWGDAPATRVDDDAREIA